MQSARNAPIIIQSIRVDSCIIVLDNGLNTQQCVGNHLLNHHAVARGRVDRCHAINSRTQQTRACGRCKAYSSVAIMCSACKPQDRIRAPSAEAAASILTNTVPHSTALHTSFLFGMVHGAKVAPCDLNADASSAPGAAGGALAGATPTTTSPGSRARRAVCATPPTPPPRRPPGGLGPLRLPPCERRPRQGLRSRLRRPLPTSPASPHRVPTLGVASRCLSRRPSQRLRRLEQPSSTSLPLGWAKGRGAPSLARDRLSNRGP